MKVICISGKIGSGKDTTAAIIKRLLQQRGYNVELTAYADPLKHATGFLLGDVTALYDRDGKDSKDGAMRRKLLVSIGEAANKVKPDIFAKFILDDAKIKLKGKKKTILIITDLRKMAEWEHTRGNSDCYTIRIKGSFHPCLIPEIANAPIECELDHLDNLLKIKNDSIISDDIAIFEPLRTFVKEGEDPKQVIKGLELNKQHNLNHLNNIVDDLIKKLY